MLKTLVETILFTAVLMLLVSVYGIFGDEPTPLFDELTLKEAR